MFTASSIASLLLGFLGKFLMDYVKDSKDRKAVNDVAAARAEAEQAKNTNTALQASLDAAVNAPKNVPDAVKALREGQE